jgi:hypothetical protein
MDEKEFRGALRQVLFDAAQHRAGSQGSRDHGWADQATAHAVERLATSWPYKKGIRSRDELLDDVRNELSKTDNSLVRAIDPEWLADSLMRLEESK